MDGSLDDRFFFSQDALDRRCALGNAVALASQNTCTIHGCTCKRESVIAAASEFYAWLRRRDTLRATSLVLTAGIPFTEGTTPMAATFTMPDSDEVVFTLSGLDAKGVDVPAPSDTWNYTLADPDNSGAVLTVAGDTLSATVAAGTPTANLVLSAAGAGTGLQAQCAITVEAGAATGIDLVPGTPSAEPPAA
jgi:hypothetical protein